MSADPLLVTAAALDWPGRTQHEQARHRIGAKRAARIAYPDAPHFACAFVKGWHARLIGRSRDENPYKGRPYKRGDRRQGGTFTFAWRAAWERGWLEASTS